MTEVDAEKLAKKLVELLETGDAAPGLLAADVFCDLSMPTWRVQTQGIADLLDLRRAGGHPSTGRVTRWRCDPTPRGFVLEFEERWQADGRDWYAREMVRADVEGGAVTNLSVYCTGDWDRAREAEHAREVRLLRP
ncbi:MAG TPA: hypothetical protein VLB44_02360 [Kofleriaceae bacterium]|nr:hypothetical protein [Kofleriaceae bacterium]